MRRSSSTAGPNLLAKDALVGKRNTTSTRLVSFSIEEQLLHRKIEVFRSFDEHRITLVNARLQRNEG